MFAHAMRHRGGGFGGHHHQRPGDPEMDGFGLGRKLRSADLQLLILALLAEQPRHGYELIKAIDEKSRGYYVPSPGMIYPALSYLEETGHAKVELEGTKKRYSLTAEGEAHLAENRAGADALLDMLGRLGERMERAREAWSGEAPGAGFFGRGRRHLDEDLHEVLHALRSVVREAAGRGLDEQRRVAGILKRAIAEIGSPRD